MTSKVRAGQKVQIRCPHCHVPFESRDEPSWTDIVCPSCDNSFSLLGAAPTCSYRSGVKVLGRFELVHEVGSGRFGSVWKARDTQLQRTVAVKIPRQRDLTEQETELFLRDARAAAQLHHAGIASVHEIGREDDTLYIVTDFIDGANLNEWLSGKRLAPHESAALVCKIAEALHHAHNAGVIHRDVKPGNIMLDRDGQPYVIDFGLAKREVGEVTMTADGQVLGTPAYMSPEQARGEGHQADRRSDIYSLGVVLFKLLTGELPFRGELRMLLLQIINDEPPSPRALNANVPRDLETITLKCLEKDAMKRYQTGHELAEDLTHFLTGEPIKARPVSRVERAWRWCKRHRELASVSAALLLLLLCVSIVAPIIAVHEARLRKESEQRGKELQNQVAQNLFQRACTEAEKGLAANGMALLAAAFRLADSDSQLNASIRTLLPGWATQTGLPLVHEATVLAVAMSPDARTAITAGHDHAAHVWELRTMTPNGSSFNHADAVRAAAFSPNGLSLLTGSQDSTGQLWNLKTRTRSTEPLRHMDQVWAVAFSPDGKTVATGGKDHEVRFWDTATGASLGSTLHHPQNILAIAYSPDGKQLVTGCWDGIARVWDIQTKQQSKDDIRVGAPVYTVAFSPNGKKILTGSANRSAQIWDAGSLKQIGEPLRHDHFVYAATWSPDGHGILTGSFDKTARLWNAETHRPIGEPLQHGGWVMAVAFSPDGRSVITGSADHLARIWRTGPAGSSVDVEDRKATRIFLDTKTALAKTAIHVAQLWNPQPGAMLSAPLFYDPWVSVLATSPTNDSVVLLRRSENEAWLWDIVTNTRCGEPFRQESAISAAAFDIDGRHLVTGGQDQLVRLWDVTDGRLIRAPIQHGGIVKAAAFSTNGKWIISGGGDQTAKIWNARTGLPRGEPMLHPAEIRAVAFSADDRLALTVCSDGSARLWDTESCKLVAKPLEFDLRTSANSAVNVEGTFNLDGSAINFQYDDGTTRRYRVPQQLANDASFVNAWAISHCALEADNNGLVRTISASEWQSAQRELQAKRSADQDSR